MEGGEEMESWQDRMRARIKAAKTPLLAQVVKRTHRIMDAFDKQHDSRKYKRWQDDPRYEGFNRVYNGLWKRYDFMVWDAITDIEADYGLWIKEGREPKEDHFLDTTGDPLDAEIAAGYSD